MFKKLKVLMYSRPDDLGGSGDESQSINPATGRTYTEAEYRELKSKHDGLSGYATRIKQDFNAAETARKEAETRAAQLEAEANVLKQTSAEEVAKKAAELEKVQREAAELKRKQELRALVRGVNKALVDDFDDGILRLDGLSDEEAKKVVDAYNNRHSALQQRAVEDNMSGVVIPPQTNAQQNAGMTLDELSLALLNTDPNSKDWDVLFKELDAATKREFVDRGERIIHGGRIGRGVLG